MTQGVFAFVMALVLALAAATTSAQQAAAPGLPAVTPAAVPAPPKAPASDAFVVGYAQAVAGWQTAVTTACQQLDVTKTYQQVLANATKEIEAHVPGYTMDWSTGKLVAKPPPATK